MDPGRVDARPGDDGRNDVGQLRPHPEPLHREHAGEPERGNEQPRERDARGVEERDDDLGDEGEAVVVDPRRDVGEYLKIARENDLVIKYVLETHRQEDFVIGSRQLSEITGAKVVSLDHALFGHSDMRLKDGEALSLGGLAIRALHTPGAHPREHLLCGLPRRRSRACLGRLHRRP